MKNLLFIGIIVILIIAGIFGYLTLTKKEKIPKKITMPEEKPTVSPEVNKKIAMIISFRNFRDAEYFVPKEILEAAGREVNTASNKIGTAIGADGGEAQVEFLISEINPADLEGIIFVGGPGTLENLDNESSYQLCKQTVSQGKVLASICISPIILAKAGVLEGKRATVWSSSLDRSPIKTLENYGAIYEQGPVVVDGKIITANGPAAAKEFGETLTEILNSQK